MEAEILADVVLDVILWCSTGLMLICFGMAMYDKWSKPTPDESGLVKYYRLYCENNGITVRDVDINFLKKYQDILNQGCHPNNIIFTRRHGYKFMCKMIEGYIEKKEVEKLSSPGKDFSDKYENNDPFVVGKEYMLGWYVGKHLITGGDAYVFRTESGMANSVSVYDESYIDSILREYYKVET